MLDLYNKIVDNEYELIPIGEELKAEINIMPDRISGNLVTKSKTSDAEYLNLALTIMDGKYAGRKIFHKIGIKGTKVNEQGEDMWAKMGGVELKHLVGSARNICMKDKREEVKKKLKLDKYEDINGMVCKVLVGVEAGQNGYSDRNKVAKFITPDKVAEVSLDDNIPF